MTAHLKRAGILLGAFAALLAIAIPAVAHHSFAAEFDTNKRVKLTGKVTQMKWANPHAWIYIDVVGSDGKATNWALEMNAANSLLRNGWRREDLPVGTVLVVEGWQARNGSPTANITSVTFTDGRRLFAGSSNPAAREPAAK
jgi:uncharacterized membrane protein YgdD (TMEM256/DUF423 family)